MYMCVSECEYVRKCVCVCVCVCVSEEGVKVMVQTFHYISFAR